MSERLAAASATAAAQQAAMQRLGMEMEREAGRVSAAEHEMSQRTTQLRRVHEQLCSLHNAGSVVAAAGLSWAGLMEDMAQQVSAVGAALALSESRHAMAIEEAARMGADLTHLRHELRETTDRAAAASKRNAEAQSIAAVVHQDELNKAVAAERNRSETQLAEVVAQYGGKVVRPFAPATSLNLRTDGVSCLQRAIEAEFSQRKARVEAAEKSAATQAQLCEEANRQAAEAERRTSVLKSEAERSNEHAAVRLGHCSACLVDYFDWMFGSGYGETRVGVRESATGGGGCDGEGAGRVRCLHAPVRRGGRRGRRGTFAGGAAGEGGLAVQPEDQRARVRLAPSDLVVDLPTAAETLVPRDWWCVGRRRVAEMGTQASHFEDRARAAQQQAHREAAAKASEAAAGMRSELGEREATISELQREVRTHHSSAVTCLKKSLTGGCGARWPSCVRQGNRTRRSMRR